MQRAPVTKGYAAAAGPVSSCGGVSAAAPQGAALRLQAALGNQATARLLRAQAALARTEGGEAVRGSSGRPHPAHPRLEVSDPGDALEIEAERVADEVMRMPGPGAAVSPPMGRSGDRVDRACASCAAEDELQRTESGAGGEAVAPPIVHDVLGGAGRPLDAATRTFMEPRFGHDFGNVRVHDDASAAASARAVNAVAYTHGSDIVFDAGRYAPDTADGKHLLAHELAHTIQQGFAPALADPSPAAPGGDPAASIARVAVVQRTAANIQRMAPCPAHLADTDPTPAGWKPYHGDSSVFHCGFRGILELRAPTADDPMNECFYDHSGALVDEHHPYAGCRGTPDQYDSARDPIRHATIDSGGIARAGFPAFVTSRLYTVEQAIVGGIRTAASIIQTAAGVVQSISQGFGSTIALGILTGRAIADPGNWNFQGLPARSVRHLKVMGALLGSTVLNQTPDHLLQSLTRRLDSLPIAGLLDEIAQDVNQALQQRSPGTAAVTGANLGELSLIHLVDWLRSVGLLQYVQAPEDIARAQLAAQQPPGSPPAR